MDDKARQDFDFEPRHAFVSVEGVRVHVAELGIRSRHVPVVLLHGLNDSHLIWKRVAPLLAKSRLVLMPDLAGHGLSDRPNASYELRWHAHVIAKWMESAGIEQADIVGHSFGGGVAQVMLLECRERIRRLVLVASGGLGREITLALRLASLPRVVELFGQRFMALGTRLAIQGTKRGFSRDDIAELSAMNGEGGSARAFARTVRDVIDWRGQRRTFFEGAHEVAELPPISVCWGDRDSIIPVAHAKAFADFVEGVTVTQFEGCGHYLHCEQSEKFVHAVLSFLDDATVLPARIRAVQGKALPTARLLRSG